MKRLQILTLCLASAFLSGCGGGFGLKGEVSSPYSERGYVSKIEIQHGPKFKSWLARNPQYEASDFERPFWRELQRLVPTRRARGDLPLTVTVLIENIDIPNRTAAALAGVGPEAWVNAYLRDPQRRAVLSTLVGSSGTFMRPYNGPDPAGLLGEAMAREIANDAIAEWGLPVDGGAVEANPRRRRPAGNARR